MFCYCTLQLCSSHFSPDLVIWKLKVTGSGAQLVGGSPLSFFKNTKEENGEQKKEKDSFILEKSALFVCIYWFNSYFKYRFSQETSPAPKTSWLCTCRLFFVITIFPNLFRYQFSAFLFSETSRSFPRLHKIGSNNYFCSP